MKKGTATGDNHLYKETLKAGEVTTLKILNVYQKDKYLQCGRKKVAIMGSRAL